MSQRKIDQKHRCNELRAHEYEKMDGETIKAIIETLEANGLSLPPRIVGFRQSVKRRFPK